MTSTTNTTKQTAAEAREAARETWTKSYRAGFPLTGAELAEPHGFKESWGLARIREAKKLLQESSPVVIEDSAAAAQSLPPVVTPPAIIATEPHEEPEARAVAAPAVVAPEVDRAETARPHVEPEPVRAETARVEMNRKERRAADRAARKAAKAAAKAGRPSWRGRAWAWVTAKFVWLLYVALFQVAAFGLFQVLTEVAGVPELTSLFGALGIELIGVTFKLLADKAQRGGESYKVVRSLLVASGFVAVGIGGVNAWGHAQLDIEGNAAIAAAMYGSCSVAAYAIWTISSALSHRAALRAVGKLEGPGVRIPDYIKDRYDDETADRAWKISRLHADMSIEDAVQRAREEIEAGEREAREAKRAAAVRAALEEYDRAAHKGNKLAAAMESARYSDDELSDLFTASAVEHEEKKNHLLNWLKSQRTDAL